MKHTTNRSQNPRRPAAVALSLATRLLLFAIAVSAVVRSAAHESHTNSRHNAASGEPAQTNASSPGALNVTNVLNSLPPLPVGVTELKFSEFFKPIGARGLEYSDKLRGLADKRVRILGYMVRQSQPVAHQLLLAPMPLTLHEGEYGFAEDMPAAVLHVSVQTNLSQTVAHTPGLLLLTGKLSIGNREEPDGRISTVRLALDAPTAEQERLITALSASPQITFHQHGVAPERAVKKETARGPVSRAQHTTN